MSRRVTTVLALAFLWLVPTAGWCQLANYTQDFEDLKINAPSGLSSDGWLVFGNVFSSDGTVYYYGYGPFPAPNDGLAFCALDSGQGGEEQGDQQLSVYSDYENADHANGYLIESNVYQEQYIGAADAGSWSFEFDYKKGNIAGASVAKAFIKIIDPLNGYQDHDSVYYVIPTDNELWNTHSMSIDIDLAWEGQILQFGFLNTATNYEGSGIFYDNVAIARQAVSNLDIFPETCDHTISKKPTATIEAALTGGPGFDVSSVNPASLLLEGVAPDDYYYLDVVGQYLGVLPVCVCPEELGPDGYSDLVMVFDDPAAIIEAAGVKRPGFYTLTLTGESSGAPFEYKDCIEIPSPKPEK